MQLKTSITQVRNVDKWHWQQSFSVGNNGKFPSLCWNVVVDDGRKVLRWYVPPNSDYTVITGIAEKDDDHIKMGQPYVSIRKFGEPMENYVFTQSNNGIFEFSGKQDGSNF